MKKTSVLLLCVSVLFLMVAGCAHYKVTDTQTGKVYYTTNMHRLSGGGVKFEDEATERDVRLQSSEYHKITKKEFNQGVYGSAHKDGRSYGEKWEDTDKESTDGCR